MPNRDVIVIGASAGGIEALRKLCAHLSPEIDASIMVAVHTSPHANGFLPQLLGRAGRIPATHPCDYEPIQKNRIYVAPPDHHLIVERGRLRTIQGPRENHTRPAIDPLFRSAAIAYGPRVIGVILSGLLDDGTSGLMVVRAHGGRTIVQDPCTAPFPAMPANALEGVPDSFVVPVQDIPQLLAELIPEQVEDVAPAERKDNLAERESRVAVLDMAEIDNETHVGQTSQFACPECGGVLWEIDQEGLLRFRCRVGHAYTARHLDAEQRQTIEAALWAALRALEESASLYRKMAQRKEVSRHPQTREAYVSRANETSENAKTLRNFLLEIGAPKVAVD